MATTPDGYDFPENALDHPVYALTRRRAIHPAPNPHIAHVPGSGTSEAKMGKDGAAGRDTDGCAVTAAGTGACARAAEAVPQVDACMLANVPVVPWLTAGALCTNGRDGVAYIQ